MKNIKGVGFIAYFLVFLAVIIRVLAYLDVLPLPANFAPIAALALFGGVYLGKKYAILIPLAAEIIADYFIGFYQAGVMLTVWGTFALVGLIGLLIRRRKKVSTLIYGTLGSSVLFFLTTNFAVWATGTWYPRTWEGLGQCFILAIPFFRNTLLGDMFFVALFFGIYEIVVYLYKQKEEARELA